jgi:hypothetical protein
MYEVGELKINNKYCRNQLLKILPRKSDILSLIFLLQVTIYDLLSFTTEGLVSDKQKSSRKLSSKHLGHGTLTFGGRIVFIGKSGLLHCNILKHIFMNKLDRHTNKNVQFVLLQNKLC